MSSYIQPPYIPPVWDRYDAINKLDTIEPGITTKEEVLKRVGRPDEKKSSGKLFEYSGWTDVTLIFIPLNTDVRVLSGGEGAIRYDATNRRVLKPPFNPAHPGGHPWTVIVRFDENDVVISVSAQEETITQGVVKEAGAYCPNADLGHADAQLHIGDIYYSGSYGQEVDPVRAWVWYSLAAKGGEMQAAEKLAQVTAVLSPEQLAEAQRQLAAWQPGHCLQELVQDAAGH